MSQAEPVVQNETFEQWLHRIAEIKQWNAQTDENPEWIDIYVSRIDGGYLCFGNLTDDLRYLYNAGITEQIQMKEPDGNVCCIGFNPATQEWYGWSHRAICGFGIGSEVKKGHNGYMPTNADDFLEESIRFWSDEDHIEVAGIKDVTNERGELGAQITYFVADTVANPAARGQLSEHFMYYPKSWGRGEWKAETLEDAKQMAIDFAESVG